jgi:hypothetical protein
VLDVSDWTRPRPIGRATWDGGDTHTCLPLPGRKLAVVIWPAAPELRRRAFLRYARLMPVLIAVLVAAGVYLSILRLAHVSDLWTQSYGQVLLVKLGLVSIALAWGGLHHLVARPLVERMAEALALLGTHHALIVHGDDGVDEISICAPTQVAEVRDGQVRSYEIEPETFGFRRASPDEVRGADAQTNAEITRAILAGESGARRSVVLLNAAAALVAGGLAPTFDDGVDRAARAIDSGAAAETLRRLVEVSRRYAVAG